MHYRKAKIKDFEALCLLRTQLAHEPDDKQTTEYAAYSPEPDRAWIKKCLKARRKLIFIAEDGGKIYAHTIIHIEKVSPAMQAYYTYSSKVLLVHLYVDQNSRRRGIGKALMKHTLDYLSQKGFDFIDLDCYLHNHKAAALYDSLGFQNVFVRKRLDFKK